MQSFLRSIFQKQICLFEVYNQRKFTWKDYKFISYFFYAFKTTICLQKIFWIVCSIFFFQNFGSIRTFQCSVLSRISAATLFPSCVILTVITFVWFNDSRYDSNSKYLWGSGWHFLIKWKKIPRYISKSFENMMKKMSTFIRVA